MDIVLLKESIHAEDMATSMPVLLIGFTHDEDGSLVAIAVGDEGEPRLIPWIEGTLRIAWKFDHRRGRWEDVGPGAKAGEDEG